MSERNQCDGCRAGLPVRNSNGDAEMHYDPKTGRSTMVCQKKRYSKDQNDTYYPPQSQANNDSFNVALYSSSDSCSSSSSSDGGCGGGGD